MSNELLEREFEKLHGIKWADATFAVFRCAEGVTWDLVLGTGVAIGEGQ